MNFHKNELINTTLFEFYRTFSCTLDTAEYVPEKYNKKIHKFIYKNMRKAFRIINREDRKFQRNLRKENKNNLKINKKRKKINKNK